MVRRCLRYGTKKDRDSTEQRNPCGGLRLSFRERANPSGGTAPVEPSVRLERISSQPGLLPQQHGIVNDFGRRIKNPDAYSRLFFPFGKKRCRISPSEHFFQLPKSFNQNSLPYCKTHFRPPSAGRRYLLQNGDFRGFSLMRHAGDSLLDRPVHRTWDTGFLGKADQMAVVIVEFGAPFLDFPGH